MREKQNDELVQMYRDLGEIFDEEYEKRRLITPRNTAEKLTAKGYRKQKHGTWYHGTENGVVYAKCSACGRRMNYSCYGYAYCSLCGARMDGAE